MRGIRTLYQSCKEQRTKSHHNQRCGFIYVLQDANLLLIKRRARTLGRILKCWWDGIGTMYAHRRVHTCAEAVIWNTSYYLLFFEAAIATSFAGGYRAYHSVRLQWCEASGNCFTLITICGISSFAEFLLPAQKATSEACSVHRSAEEKEIALFKSTSGGKRKSNISDQTLVSEAEGSRHLKLIL